MALAALAELLDRIVGPVVQDTGDDSRAADIPPAKGPDVPLVLEYGMERVMVKRPARGGPLALGVELPADGCRGPAVQDHLIDPADHQGIGLIDD